MVYQPQEVRRETHAASWLPARPVGRSVTQPQGGRILDKALEAH